jgi:dTDP-4-amino-4,6-dideoxygalactose transaminase
VKNYTIKRYHEDDYANWNTFVSQAKNATFLFHRDFMDNGIQRMIHYPIPPHKQKAFSNCNKLTFQITEKIHNEVLSLPISTLMTYNVEDFIIEILNTY